MYILNAYGETIPCDKAIKGPDYIHCYEGDTVIAHFNGISDISSYTLTNEGGSPANFAEPELDEITQLQLALAELYEGVHSNG